MNNEQGIEDQGIEDVDDMVYLATEIEQIRHDFEEDDGDETLDEYAMEWVRLNGKKFAELHNRK